MVKYSQVKYFPEEILEAKVETLPNNVPELVEDLSRFAMTPGDMIMSLLEFSAKPVRTVEFYVNADGKARRLDVQTMGVPGIYQTNRCLINAQSSLQLRLLDNGGGGQSDYPIRYLIRVDKPTVIDKIKLKIPLTDEEKKISNKYKLPNLISTNTILVHRKEPLETIVVPKRWDSTDTISAGSTTQIGDTIVMPSNRYGVLEEIGVEGFDWRGGAAVTDNYIRVQRDTDRNNYLDLNCYAMSPFIDETDILNTANTAINTGNKMRIPFVDKLYVELYNGSTINYDTFRVWYKYSVYMLGISDKIKWNLPSLALSKEEQDVATEMDIWDKVKAGLI